MRSCLILAAVLVAGMAHHAQAGPAYSAEDIIRNFEPRANEELGASRGLGASRALCVGTQAECPVGGAPAAAAAPVFDLMVTFDLNSDKLTEEAKVNLQEFARALRDSRLSRIDFDIEGHTDARGAEAHNMSLSRRRAEAVVSYLESLGVDTGRIRPRAFGMSRPRTDDPFDAVNRRVETRVRQ